MTGDLSSPERGGGRIAEIMGAHGAIAARPRRCSLYPELLSRLLLASDSRRVALATSELTPQRNPH